MENLFLELLKVSPLACVMLVVWFYQRKDSIKRDEDYKGFVESVQEDNKQREKNMQETVNKNQEIIDKNQEIIHRNQEIIKELTIKFDVVEEVKKDVEEIKVIIKNN